MRSFILAFFPLTAAAVQGVTHGIGETIMVAVIIGLFLLGPILMLLAAILYELYFLIRHTFKNKRK